MTGLSQIKQGRDVMHLTGLGYVGIRTAALDDWAIYGTRLLGMQIVDRSAKQLSLRMDDRRQRVIVSDDGGKASASTAGRSPTAPRSIGSPPGSSAIA